MGSAKGLVFDIKRFALHDGEGIRTTVFLKGCPLSCKWCHNPEGIAGKPQVWQGKTECMDCGCCIKACAQGALARKNGRIVADGQLCIRCGACVGICPTGAMKFDSKEMGADEVLDIIEKDAVYYGVSGGGLTLSGGDPTLQCDFAAELLCKAKGRGLGTAIETSMFCPWETLERLMPYIDHFYVDIKVWDDAGHRHATGVSNGRIIENFKKLAAAGCTITCRTPIIPGYTDSRENIESIAGFINRVRSDIPLELMEFNPLGASKYQQLDIENHLVGESKNKERYEMLKVCAKAMGVTVI